MATGTMNWDDLRVVSAIYKAGSFARAAQALHLDETTIGRRLARIEAALGRPPDRSGASGEPDAGRIAAEGGTGAGASVASLHSARALYVQDPRSVLAPCPSVKFRPSLVLPNGAFFAEPPALSMSRMPRAAYAKPSRTAAFIMLLSPSRPRVRRAKSRQERVAPQDVPPVRHAESHAVPASSWKDSPNQSAQYRMAAQPYIV